MCLAIAGVATLAGRAVPVIGAPVVGLVIGVLVAIARKPGMLLAPGIRFCSRQVLQVAVALLGLQLTLGEAVSSGVSSLPVLVGTLVICLAAAVLLGRALRVRGSLRTLVGVGTAICGASAIAAVTPVIDAAAVDVAYALSTVF
ncbi:MAG: putative sulfate exporter family transporter, partial [Candidatus Dormibacteraeota bacterium]|nr:putative sulfate exporter family transporter [Candidatus Dormibacteraeota bacterium]